MANRARTIQGIIRHFKDDLGKKEVDMHEVVDWAVKRGMKLPEPVDPRERLVREFSRAAREETRRDPNTGKPYRANHAMSITQGGKQLTLWIDIDEATRVQMHKSLVQRREQMVGDGLQLSLDMDHWNTIHASEEPITLPMDFTDDIEWRKNAPDENENAAAE